MKYINKLNKALIAILLTIPFLGSSQNMQWIPSAFVKSNTCYNKSDCNKNVVCYSLQYTPANTGVITSYTTGFFVNCEDQKAKILINESCIMPDNSREINACGDMGKMLLNCSGNSGSSTVSEGKRILLHQICFEIETDAENVMISKDDITNLTVGLDVQSNSFSQTEYPEYLQFEMRNYDFCKKFKANLFLETSSDKHQESKLVWSPAQEKNEGLYEIFWSQDSEIFESIGSMEANNLKQGEMKYEFIHKDALIGENFYKVQYIFEDESLASNIESQTFSKETGLTIFPNPADDVINVQVNSKKEVSSIEIYNNYKVLIKSIVVNSFETQILDVSAYPPGVYTAKMQEGDKIVTKKFVVVHK